MKCHKPNTDQEASVEVFANDYRCPEYVLPSASNSDPNIVECFIPVSDGEKITIKGNFKGTVLYGAIDLLADGSFLADTHIESRNGEAKVSIRKIDIQKVFDVPEPGGPVVEGDLHVRPLEDGPSGTSHGECGVGSLAIVISVTQKKDDHYEIVPAYPDTTCGGWKERDGAPDSGIVPTHELSVKVTDDDVHKNRQSKHRRHAKQLRFGSKPWAKFIFYYRSRAAIEAAGCMTRPDESHALEPKDSEDNVVDSIEGTNGNTKAGTQTPVPVPKKQKLFGQPLFPAQRAQSQEMVQQQEVPAGDAAAPSLDAVVGSNQQSTVAATPSSLSQKRSIGSAGTSRDGTPNKKPRMSDKKAALLAQIEEKRQRKEADKKALEEQQKLREEKQRELEAEEAEEIEELERMNAAEDEELEELARAKAVEEAKIEELKEALNEG